MAFDDRWSKEQLARDRENLLKVMKQDYVSQTIKSIPKPSTSQSPQEDSRSKVICTWAFSQGLMTREDYILGVRYAKERLTDRHYRGYHAWALAVVRHMRHSKRATSFWSFLARARADHIAYMYGNQTRRNRLGAVLCALGHPICHAIGGFVGEQDWQALYRTATSNEPT